MSGPAHWRVRGERGSQGLASDEGGCREATLDGTDRHIGSDREPRQRFAPRRLAGGGWRRVVSRAHLSSGRSGVGRSVRPASAHWSSDSICPSISVRTVGPRRLHRMAPGCKTAGQRQNKMHPTSHDMTARNEQLRHKLTRREFACRSRNRLRRPRAAWTGTVGAVATACCL